MARIAGVDLPRDKRLEIGLTYIFGVGLTRSHEICKELGLDADTKIKDLTEDEAAKIRRYIEATYQVEGDLRREVASRTSSARLRLGLIRVYVTVVDFLSAASARTPTPAPARDRRSLSPARRK